VARLKATNRLKYGLSWPLDNQTDFEIERQMCRFEGTYNIGKQVFGNGLFFHFKAFISLLWPHFVWHRWADLFVQEYLKWRTLVVIGPANSGKTACAAVCVLADYYLYPDETTVLICSTTKELLEQRIWGEMKANHRKAKELHPVPGNLIEGRMRLVTDPRDEAKEGRDFRNGVLGVALFKGNEFAGVSTLIGCKNKRVRVVCDELQLAPRAVVDAISNLDKNDDLKFLGLGNPKDTTDALGVLGEPSAAKGGWEGRIDQNPVTKVWETRRPKGGCIQFVGSDSPNLDGKMGIPIISQEKIDADVAFYGKESVWYTMMNQGMMPRGQGSRRVITRQACEKFHARDEPLWRGTIKRKGAGLDAAYRGVGGDRCMVTFVEWGEESMPDENGAVDVSAMNTGIISQEPVVSNNRLILATTDTLVVPINPQLEELPEDQIVNFVRKECESRGIGPENVFYDSGMRTSLVTAFSRLWSNACESVDCMGTASEQVVSGDIATLAKDHYFNKITEIWYSVRLCIEAGQWRGLRDGAMWEFCQREYGYTGKNKIQVEPKDKMKIRCGRSPDEADCNAIALYGALRRGFVIRKLKPPKELQVNEDWKRDIKNQFRQVEKEAALDYSA